LIQNSVQSEHDSGTWASVNSEELLEHLTEYHS